MSDTNELLELGDDLDYEMEESLLVSDEEKCEEESDTVKQMPFAFGTQSKPLPTSHNLSGAQHQIDLWRKSFATFAILSEKSAKPVNVALKHKNMTKEKTELKKIQEEVLQPVQEGHTAIQQQQVVLEPERKDEMNCEQMQGGLIEQTNIESVDTMELKTPKPQTRTTFRENSERLAVLSSSSSSSSSPTSEVDDSQRKRFRNRNPNQFDTNRFQNISAQRNHPNDQNLITFMAAAAARSNTQSNYGPLMSIPLPKDELTPAEKIPFIIRAQSSGSTASRKVLVNPTFGGFSSNNDDNANHSQFYRKRERPDDSPAAAEIEVPSSAVPTKHKLIRFEEEKETIAPESGAVEEMVVELSEEDKNYLLEIEKQKLKRAEVLRQKEVQREIDFQREKDLKREQEVQNRKEFEQLRELQRRKEIDRQHELRRQEDLKKSWASDEGWQFLE